MANPDNLNVKQSREALRRANVRFQDLPPADLKRRFPQFRAPGDAIAIFEPDSGALMARQAVAAIVDQFVRDGGAYRQAAVATPKGQGRLEEVRTSEGDSVRADAFVFACGPWLGKVFPELLGNRIFPTRQEVFFFGVPAGDLRFEPAQMPVWIDYSDDRGMYGFPDLERRGVKVACDLHGPAIDPDAQSRIVSAEAVAAARGYVADRFPALAQMPIVESRVCQYENTSNGDFLIDRHPDFENVWMVGGGSGHGFKHGPAVGEYVAARVTGAQVPQIEPRFSLATKATEQKRSVH
jgi:glycine/D-amino acid oxidase-like deaminating enzyme